MASPLQTERAPYSADHYLKTGETLPDAGFTHLRDETDADLRRGIGDPRVPGMSMRGHSARSAISGWTCTSISARSDSRTRGSRRFAPPTVRR